MRITCVTLFAGLGLLLTAVPASSQVFCSPIDESDVDSNDAATCLAATATPFGALPTKLPASWLGRAAAGIGFSLQFGSMDEEGEFGRRNLAVGIDIPAGRATLGLTGGVVGYTRGVGGGENEIKKAHLGGGRVAP